MIVLADSNDVTVYVLLTDPTGLPATGLTVTDLDVTFVRDRATSVQGDAIALASADTAHSDNGMFEIDATNCPGLYRVDLPDAAVAAGSGRVQVVVNGAAIAPAVLEVDLVGFDPAEPFGGGDVDSTGTEVVSRDKALEVILAVLAGISGGTNSPEFMGRDGATPVAALTLTGSGVRTMSQIDP